MELARLPKSRLGGAAALLARALHDDPFSEYFFSHPRRRSGALRVLERAVIGDAWPFQHVHGAFADRELIGVTAWLPPGAHRQGLARQLRQLPRLLSVAVRFPRAVPDVIRIAEAERSIHPDIPHWWLVVVGVEPEQQGRGIGSFLVEAFNRRCDLDAIGGYLRTTNPANLPFYESHGFEVLDELRITAQAPPMWLMWRQADA